MGLLLLALPMFWANFIDFLLKNGQVTKHLTDYFLFDILQFIIDYKNILYSLYFFIYKHYLNLKTLCSLIVTQFRCVNSISI